MTFFSRSLRLLAAGIAGLLLLTGCHSVRNMQQNTAGTRHFYDTSTLAVGSGPVLMPYNRVIDAAGQTIRYGNPALENHSLDCILLNDGQVLAVEDRYGVAFIDVQRKALLYHLDYTQTYNGLMSTYSGIKTYREGKEIHVLWAAANKNDQQSFLLDAVWDGTKAQVVTAFPFRPKAPSPLALPNDIAIAEEQGERYVYVVLNGNSEVVKIRWKNQQVAWVSPTGMAPFGIALAQGKLYVSNWGGPRPADSTRETAGIPYAGVYIDPRTGATAMGTVSVLDAVTGRLLKELEVGLHPNAVLAGAGQRFVYVANGNSDLVSVIDAAEDVITASLPVKLDKDNAAIGDSPNALALDSTGTRLYVANGMDNAVAVIQLGTSAALQGRGQSRLLGFIPTEAYPAGLAIGGNQLFVANLEAEGARVPGKNNSYTAHHQQATVSVIPLPADAATLAAYTTRVQNANLLFRARWSRLLPRKNVPARPVPERIGEPSVFKHVLYIIKENRTYDQVLGDMKEGDGMPALCMYGDSTTPNHHQLARHFLLMDNYYVSGKSSAEGHQWTDAAMTTDYVEKNVRAWFRSYPHVQTDALVYNKEGFIWNNALDHGKTVRIYGEACIPEWRGKLGWKEIYQLYTSGQPFHFTNITTISRVKPILSANYPGYDGHEIADQLRAEAFIRELHAYESKPGDEWPQLMVMALPADHTAGTRPGFPTPAAMVADNDLALGRIVEAVSHSRFWDSTAIFVTEDDSQDGWDHVSAYRTAGFVISPYSRLHTTVHTNLNQTSMVRTIEQILGIPPMNLLDATALPMFDCFGSRLDTTPYRALANRIPLDQMNKDVSALRGRAKRNALLSSTPQFDHIDGGSDELLNRILWFEAMGSRPYPKSMTLPEKEAEEAD